jgi:hypothetical protein
LRVVRLLIQALGQTLGLAVGIAIFPVPIIAVILMLFSPAAGRNAGSFLAGWMLGLAAVAFLALVVGIGSDGGDRSGDVARLIIGALLVFLGARKWIGRSRSGGQADMPAWMSVVDEFSAPRAFALGIALAALNPKNFGLTVAAVVSIGSAGLGPTQEIATVIIFVLLASAGVLAPVLAYLFARERVEPGLDSAREWLVENNSTVMTVLLFVLGAVLLGDGIAGLA